MKYLGCHYDRLAWLSAGLPRVGPTPSLSGTCIKRLVAAGSCLPLRSAVIMSTRLLREVLTGLWDEKQKSWYLQDVKDPIAASAEVRQVGLHYSLIDNIAPATDGLPVTFFPICKASLFNLAIDCASKMPSRKMAFWRHHLAFNRATKVRWVVIDGSTAVVPAALEAAFTSWLRPLMDWLSTSHALSLLLLYPMAQSKMQLDLRNYTETPFNFQYQRSFSSQIHRGKAFLKGMWKSVPSGMMLFLMCAKGSWLSDHQVRPIYSHLVFKDKQGGRGTRWCTGEYFMRSYCLGEGMTCILVCRVQCSHPVLLIIPKKATKNENLFIPIWQIGCKTVCWSPSRSLVTQLHLVDTANISELLLSRPDSAK